MKILQVIHSLNPQAGGTTEALRQLSTAMVRQGADVHALCLDAPDSPWLRDFPLTHFALGPGRGSYGYTPHLAPWLRQNAANYDVLVVNGLWQYGNLGVWRATRMTRTPYVVFTHGMLDPWFKRRYPLKHLKKWLYWPWAEYRVLRDAAAVYFTAEEERLEARKSFWLYRCREQVIGFGIDPPQLDESAVRGAFLEKYPELQNKRLLLFLGRMHEKKGCDLLLRAFRLVLDQGAASDLHLIMAGPHDHPYGTEMLNLTRELNLSERVTWTGMLSGDLKWGAFASSEAFVLPSHQENFGVSVVEALALGRPVLISDKVNIWREIAADNAGFVQGDDLAGTIKLLQNWLKLSTQDRESASESARRCFAARFQMEVVTARLLSSLQAEITRNLK